MLPACRSPKTPLPEERRGGPLPTPSSFRPTLLVVAALTSLPPLPLGLFRRQHAIEDRTHDLQRLFVRLRNLPHAPQPPERAAGFSLIRLLHVNLLSVALSFPTPATVRRQGAFESEWIETAAISTREMRFFRSMRHSRRKDRRCAKRVLGIDRNVLGGHVRRAIRHFDVSTKTAGWTSGR